MDPDQEGNAIISKTLTELGIDRMTVDEQIGLVEAIWNNIAAARENIPLTEAQAQELKRRLAEHHADPSKVTPWELVKEEALARFSID